jgi:CheY-like chemotaxis protein
MMKERASSCRIVKLFSQESTMSNGRAIDIRCGITAKEEHLLGTDLVLIVDDDQDILEFAAEILQTLGHNVLTARNGLEAVVILRKNARVSILFTDIQMPRMGGEELVEVAVALRPDIRVIFTSGLTRPRGDAPFLQKPYKAADLARVFSPQAVSLRF